MPGLGETTGRSERLLRALAGVLSAQGMTWIASVTGVMLVPRYLGAGDFGRVSIAYTVAQLVATAAMVGTANYLVRESARDPAATNSLVGPILALRAAVWVLLAVPGLALAAVFRPPAELLPTAIALAGSLIGLQMAALVSAFQGNMLIGRVAPLLAAISLVGTIISIVVLASGATLEQFMIAGQASNVFALLVVSILYLRRFGLPMPGGWRKQVQVARACLPFLSWDLGLLVYGKVDVLMLGLLLGAASVGEYALAYRMVSVPLFLPIVVATVLLPELSTPQGAAEVRRLLSRTVELALALAAPISTVLVVLAAPVVVLVAGHEYDRSTLVVIILAIHMPFVTTSTILGMAIIAMDRQSPWARVAWTAAIINPALNLLAIPVGEHLVGNGAAGAALTTLATELFMTARAIQLVGASLDRAELASVARRTAAASICGGGAVFSVYTVSNLVLALVAASLLFPLLLIGLRLVAPRELLATISSARRHQPASEPSV